MEPATARREDASEHESRETVPPEPPISFTSRITSHPMLHRQLTIAIHRALGPDGLPVPPTAALSDEEELKVQRYERMMDRFHLRRVPLARAASCMNLPATSHREYAHHDNNFSERHSSEAAMIDGANEPAHHSKRGSGSLNAIATGDDSASDLQIDNTPHGVVAWFSVLMESYRQPFHPTGNQTRVRLLVLVAVYVMQLVYMPYGVVYYLPNHHTTIVVDIVVDICFLLNIFVVCNTEVHTDRTPPITSRRAIWRYYRKRGFTMDVLATIPIEFSLYSVHSNRLLHWAVRFTHLLFQYFSLLRHVNRFHRAWKREVIRTEKSIIAWILYSRYSHLVRIGGIVFMVMLLAHYFACLWTRLQADVDPTLLSSKAPLAIHIHSIYDALQLLQGQGLPTTTPSQDLFGSIAVLLGSIAIAVIFGHVAILVSNFSANQTSYQRKMESVFAVMGKLQLPHPIRERVHQYYEYLHAEYESLDGEIVKFTKDLSHTLELEVVLFKYMDVVMNVPHWRECSPDFQKQLVLNLSIRVYLPDDYIMRCGEVGTECYIINRGTCKQYAYATGNYEPPTLAMLPDAGNQPLRRRRSSLDFAHLSLASLRSTRRRSVQPLSKYSSGFSEQDPLDMGPYSSITVLRRGQAIGDMALIANYERSSDLRAVSCVEMCVIERETFQQMLARYPHDREIVLTSIVHHSMLHLAAERTPCALLQTLHQVAPHVSVSTGIQLIAKAINPSENDPTIVFGVTEELPNRLRELVATHPDHPPVETVPPPQSSTPRETTSTISRTASVTDTPRLGPTTESELIAMIKDMQERLARIEKHQQTCCRGTHQSTTESVIVSPSTQPRGRTLPKLQRRPSARTPLRHTPQHTSREPRDEKIQNSAAQAPHGDIVNGDANRTQSNSRLSAPRQMLKDLVGTLWSRSTSTNLNVGSSHSPYTDQLYQSRSRRELVAPTSTAPLPRLHRETSLHRTKSVT